MPSDLGKGEGISAVMPDRDASSSSSCLLRAAQDRMDGRACSACCPQRGPLGGGHRVRPAAPLRLLSVDQLSRSKVCRRRVEQQQATKLTCVLPWRSPTMGVSLKGKSLGYGMVNMGSGPRGQCPKGQGSSSRQEVPVFKEARCGGGSTWSLGPVASPGMVTCRSGKESSFAIPPHLDGGPAATAPHNHHAGKTAALSGERGYPCSSRDRPRSRGCNVRRSPATERAR
ncbi:hypothetical protein H920_08939 [Fukomys damarensis]|uniref:Uncharacterized protein n=1 Tax=Fukomys damarensis TaxID=885580 RepID=A0A091DHB7_FUKDA|nr:hypothetical protein H920_08939 [Fukomys damarensis]